MKSCYPNFLQWQTTYIFVSFQEFNALDSFFKVRQNFFISNFESFQQVFDEIGDRTWKMEFLKMIEVWNNAVLKLRFEK